MSIEFTFGAPTPPNLLYNRKEEIDKILRRVSTIKKGIRNDIALIGPRRVGKSSILIYLEKELELKKIIPIRIDCEGLDLISFLKEYGNSVIEAELKIKGIMSKFREHLKRGFSETIATFSELIGKVKGEISLAEFLKFRIEIEKLSPVRALTEDELHNLFHRTIELPEKMNRKCVAMFDEFQETKNYSLPRGNFHSNFRALTQNQKNINYIYTGSAIGMIQEIFGNPKNPLAGNVDLIYIEPFTEKITKDFFEKKFKHIGKIISQKSLAFIYRVTGGFPAYLNWLGLKVCDLFPKKGKIPEKIVEDAYNEMLSLKSPIYQMIDRQLIKLGKKTKNVLHIIALGYSKPSDIAREVNIKNVYVYLDRLEKYGIIKKENNQFRLIDPVIEAYFKLF